MSVAIELATTAAAFDNTIETAFSDLTWTRQDQGRFRGTSAGAIGIVDPHDLVTNLEAQFGPIIDRKGLHAGALSKATDYILERTLFHAGGGAPVAPFVQGTATRAGFGAAAGQLVRLVPEVMPTEVVDAFQSGGTGQVSENGGAVTPFANGQSGVVVLPTGMRISLDGGDVADNIAVLWLTPFADPRTLYKLAQGAQPPVVYG